MEATKKCQKIKKSMGRRNAICLRGGAALSVPPEVGRGVGGSLRSRSLPPPSLGEVTQCRATLHKAGAVARSPLPPPL